MDLAPKGRSKLAEQDVSSYEPLLKWSDGQLLIGRRARGRGDVWLSTLPLSVETSDFSLRPGFLALLDAWVAEARARAAPRRGDVGSVWVFSGANSVTAEGPAGPVPVSREGGVLRVVPPLVGAYRLAIDGRKEVRVASPHLRELDLRPRAAAPGAMTSTVGDRRAAVDVSWAVALALLLLLATELGLRSLSPRQSRGGPETSK